MSDDTEMMEPASAGSGALTANEGLVNPHLPAAAIALGEGERYEVRHVLGRGGMGEVFLSLDRRLGRTIALKVMRGDRELGDEGRARFLREVRVQGQLEHPSIVPVYDLGLNAAGEPYFTMRRLEGQTLQETLELLRQGPGEPDPRELRRLLGAFCQICLAIDFAHSRGIVHRDLKPANLMLGTYGEVMVLDWGLARRLDDDDDTARAPLPAAVAGDDLTQAGFVMGSPAYMAPEQLAGERATAPSDVYALGVILFEILTRQHLHDGDFAHRRAAGAPTVAERLARASTEVPPELVDACVRATAPRPERTASARGLGAAVQAYLDGERNAELRVAMAEAHALAAEAEDAQGTSGQPRALREIGRALALDPDNARAQALLRRFFTAPVAELPPALQERQQRAQDQRLRFAGRLAAVGYLTLLAYLPVLLFMGVRSPGLVASLYAAVLATSASCLWVGFGPGRPSRASILLTLLTSTLLVAATSAVFGPLVALPPFAVGNAVAWAVLLEPRRRRLAIVLGVAAMLAPYGLELGGVLPPSLAFTAMGLTLLPRTVELPVAPTLGLIFATGAMTLIVSAVSVGRLGDALHAAEARLLLQSWKFEQLAPAADEMRAEVSRGVGDPPPPSTRGAAR